MSKLYYAFCPHCRTDDPDKKDILKPGAWVFNLRVANGFIICSTCRNVLGLCDGPNAVKLELKEKTEGHKQK